MNRMNWDDLRIFLALARADNIRAAADSCGVSYSTISRRIDAFEGQLSVRLFNRQPSGFVLTPTGEALLRHAEAMEEQVSEADRQIFGQETALKGRIKLSMVDALATNLLMPDLSDFSAKYPEIELEIDIGYAPTDLGRRESDLVLRFVQNPPDELVGRKLISCAIATYATPDYIRKNGLNKNADNMTGQWIGYQTGITHPTWVQKSQFPHLPAKGQILSLTVQKEACKANMGLAILPCFLADPDPNLQRISEASFPARFDLWLLKHADLRSNARIRVLSDFIAERIKNHHDLLVGTNENFGRPGRT